MGEEIRKAIIVTNIDVFFLTNRKEQAQVMKEMGFEIHVLAADTGRSAEIVKLGYTFHRLPAKRFGLNLIGELITIYKIHKIYKQINPVLIHHLGLKTIMLGTIAALGTGCYIFNTYTGLGYLFTVNNLKTKILRSILLLVSRVMYNNNKTIAIFQNNTDFELFKDQKVIKVARAYVIKGCGVDITKFRYLEPVKKETVRVLLPGKILSSKGIYDFVEAAKIVRYKGIANIEFVLCGGIDEGHPFSISKNELLRWTEQGLVKWLGNQSEMQQVFSDADIILLPSYREGLPKSLLEASAVGRPIITYDVAGCNEVVIDNYNGYLIPFKNINMIAERVILLSADMEMRIRMGLNSLEMVKEQFELSIIIGENINLYKKYLGDKIQQRI